ncbi:MAG: hypothetical protein HY447_04345 [Candidatus Omnitrophica bacterium]|nr:hypothetical protein [Candidatus Omnitrophota bacterium]
MHPYHDISRWFFSFTFIVVLFSSKLAFANIAGNPGFEVAIGGDTTTNWDNTNGATRESQGTLPVLVPAFDAIPEGGFALLLNATGEFTFQSTKSVQIGDLVVFTAQAESSIVDDGATTGGQLRIEFQGTDPTTGVAFTISITNSARITTANAANGDADGDGTLYQTFTISARVPPRTTQVTFTLRQTGAGNVVFDNVNAEINPVKLTLSASKTTVKPGDLVTITADFVNASAQNQTNLELKVDVPLGLDLLTDSIRVDGRPGQPFREGSTIIGIRTLRQNDRSHVVFHVLVTSGVTLGKIYEIVVTAIVGDRVSDTQGITLRVRGDPIFDEGTIVGKVFDDRNEDGTQTKGETGVPRVRIYTEYGVSVITDEDGRFHIPAVQPGRHLLKIDGHTFPPGTTFISEESLLVKTTPGLLSKVRFAVRLPESALPDEFRKELQIWVTQGIDLARPELTVAMDPDTVQVGVGRLEREPTFQMKTNYGEYITRWQLELRSEMGEKIWSGFGIGQPPLRVPWNGIVDTGEIIRPGVYAYRLIVKDSQDREDWTPLHFFQVVSKSKTIEGADGSSIIPAEGAFNIFRDGKRSIPLVAKPTVRVYGKTEPLRRVQINGVPSEVSPTGEFEEEFFVTAGEKTIAAGATNSDGDTITVEEKITVKDSYFFLVALGEEELGLNSIDGNLDTVGREDTYDEDFYQDGKLAYYLKAKIKGKFLVKSRYDTSDKRSELFTQLDPDDYYPIYGDYSQIDYEGQDTRERFFILIEMDRSFLKWGSYETEFTDTELGRYNRTLSGLKIHHETLSTTKYGDAKKGFTLFWSKPEHLADHNEFHATGGSLYYLHNRNVIQGSEKIRVEIRDKITDIPIETRDLVYGKDYEMDYRQGRILLKEPLSSVSASETIISNDILDGNSVYLIVDYEFEIFRLFEDHSAGLRGFTNFGEHIRIGGTAVEEQRANQDYDLRAVDVTYKIGRNTKITAEFAQSKLQQVRQGLSYDGGLSFQNQAPVGVRRPREKAYLIKGETKPFQPLELSGYLQNVEPGFSIDRIKSQEGFRKYGLQARLKLNEHLRFIARHDSTELSAQIRPLGLFGLSATLQEVRSTTGQAVFDYGKWNVIGEYLHQYLDIPAVNHIDSFFTERPFGNAVGLRIAHRVTDWLTPYAKGQLTFTGKQNYQIGGGLEIRAGERTKVYVEEMIGHVGDATVLGISVQRDDKTTSYAEIKVRDLGFGDKRISTSVGSSHQLSEKSRVYSEREYSTYSGNLPEDIPQTWSSDIYGYETQFWNHWDFDLRFERRHLDASDFRNLSDVAIDNITRTNTFNTLSTSLGYVKEKKLKFDTSFEARIDQDAPEVRQWLTQNLVEYHVNQNLSMLGRANFGTSRLVEPGQLAGRFVEMNVGFAYRPVETDRFNWLTKYTFLDELANDAQFVGTDSGTVTVDERAHIFSFEGAYELTHFLQMVDKFAYRLGSVEAEVADRFNVGSVLWVHRFNYHIARKWDLGVEYRILMQTEAANNFRHGPLIEIDRELYDYVRLGIGYNFTDFDDDLRRLNDIRRNGVFIRLTGKV